MRIGLSTAAYYGQMETEIAAGHIAALGIPCCEVFLETYSEYTAGFGEQVKRLLGKTDAVSIHSKTQHFEGDFFGASSRQQEGAFTMFDGFLSAGQALGAHLYVYHGPPNLRGMMPNLARWKPIIDRAIAMAAAKGIRLAWEVVSWCHLCSPERLQLFRETWPELVYVLDIKQIYELRQDPLTYISLMGDALAHVHVLDWDADGRYVLPGQGVFEFEPFLASLKANGYAGDIIVEPYGYMQADDASLLASIDWLAQKVRA